MEFNSRYNPKEVEDRIYTFWLKHSYFSARINPEKKPFVIVIPPPNITGILHMGHALNNTIQDVLIRFKRMQGFEVLWVPGTDHAGIATQNVVERELAKEGKKKEDIGREAFLARLWSWKERYGSTILEQLKKLGASCDWQRTRFTMDEEYSAAVQEVFVRLYEKGLIYRGEYIINWCPRCKTALSDEEAPRREIEGWLYYIRYPLREALFYKGEKKEYIVVATTRPETMLGDVAVAINPHDERYAWLKEAKVILPIIERELIVIEDHLIDPEFGTGIVKVTPGHDPLDFLLAKKYNLPFINIMQEDASLNENAEEFSGMDRFEAREAILEVLKEKDLIEKKEPHKINAGHCYRCHTLIEPRLSKQWFLKMKPLAKAAIQVVEEKRIRFYPERWKKVYLNWMENIQDWCISRQIWWGHRLPVYYCKDCQEKEKLVEQKGIIVAREKPTSCPFCGSKEIKQEEDVLDTWFSSWLWPFAVFYWPFNQENEKLSAERKREAAYFYPTSVLVTASEILFFWVARMIMAGLEFQGEIPFKDVFIHGTVRDERGIKMSKSLGNIIDPLEIIDRFGADSLRFSLVMLSASGADVYLSDEKFLVGRNFCNKLWNASRLIFMKLKENGFELESTAGEDLDEEDFWLISELNKTIQETTSELEGFHLNEAIKRVYEFFWHVFCDWYLEIIKDNFNLNKAKVSLLVLIDSLKLLHPFIPFITEEIFGIIKASTSLLKKEEALIIAKWPQAYLLGEPPKDFEKFLSLLETIKAIRTLKIDLGLGNRKVLLEVNLNPDHRGYWDKNLAWIKRLGVLEGIVFKDTLRRILYKSDFWALDFSIDKIDMNNFLLSLEKKIKEEQDLYTRIESRLNNADFLKHAPEDKVVEEKGRFQELSVRLSRLKELYKIFKTDDAPE